MPNENKEPKFKVRVYGRAELQYYEGLMQKLEQLGFRKAGKTFSYGQVKAIVRRLGPPDE